MTVLLPECFHGGLVVKQRGHKMCIRDSCWGHNNRSALLRIPQYKPGKGNSARIEFRALDPGANPYLAYSVLLAAGLDGIEKRCV